MEAATVADTEAAVFLSDVDSDSEEDLWEATPFRTLPIAARVPLLLPGFGGFIPGRGFAQYPMHPALRVQVPIYQLHPPLAPLVLPRYQLPMPACFASSRLARGRLQVSTLETGLRMEIFEFFPDIITTELIEQLGMATYPLHIAQWLPTNFLLSPERQELESTVQIINMDDPLELIGFSHSASEPEACIISLTASILPLVPLQRVSLCPAPTMVSEQRLAQTFLNEPHPAPTDELTEQNNFIPTVSIPSGPTESSVLIRVAPIALPNQPEIAPPIAPVAPDVPLTALIVDIIRRFTMQMAIRLCRLWPLLPVCDSC